MRTPPRRWICLKATYNKDISGAYGTKDLIIVRGGGDLATGTICKLYNCGYAVTVSEDGPDYKLSLKK